MGILTLVGTGCRSVALRRSPERCRVISQNLWAKSGIWVTGQATQTPHGIVPRLVFRGWDLPTKLFSALARSFSYTRTSASPMWAWFPALFPRKGAKFPKDTIHLSMEIRSHIGKEIPSLLKARTL